MNTPLIPVSWGELFDKKSQSLKLNLKPQNKKKCIKEC